MPGRLQGQAQEKAKGKAWIVLGNRGRGGRVGDHMVGQSRFPSGSHKGNREAKDTTCPPFTPPLHDAHSAMHCNEHHFMMMAEKLTPHLAAIKLIFLEQKQTIVWMFNRGY